MISIYVKECRRAGVKAAKARELLTRIKAVCDEAEDLGLYMFGNGFVVTLRKRDRPFSERKVGDLVLGEAEAKCEGGAGYYTCGEDGLKRGEY
jgi:hypothetical protein